MRTTVLAAFVLGCSGSKPVRTTDDAVHAVPRGDATPTVVVVGDAAVPTTGDLQVRVEWKDVPAVARNSPGRTPCNTVRAASVAPTTTWGVPEAFVFVEGAAAPPAEARVVLAECALRPRLVVARSLLLESAVDRPARVTLTKYGTIKALDQLAPGDARTIQLPIAGHAVRVALDADTVYQLATDAKEPETSWIVSAPGAVTDASGQVLVKDLAAGAHAVTAWLPPRANQLGRRASLPATIVANEQAELTVPLR